MKRPYLTATLLALCWTASLAFWTGASVATSAAQRWQATARSELLRESSWILVGWSVFLHNGWSHLLLNTVALAICGSALERAWGHLRFGMLVLASGLLGSLAQAAWSGRGDIGISGVVYACAGALATAQWRDRKFGSTALRIATAVLGVWLGVGMVEGGLGRDDIGNASHLVGVITGIAFAFRSRPVVPLKR